MQWNNFERSLERRFERGLREEVVVLVGVVAVCGGGGVFFLLGDVHLMVALEFFFVVVVFFDVKDRGREGKKDEGFRWLEDELLTK